MRKEKSLLLARLHVRMQPEFLLPFSLLHRAEHLLPAAAEQLARHSGQAPLAPPHQAAPGQAQVPPGKSACRQNVQTLSRAPDEKKNQFWGRQECPLCIIPGFTWI